MNRRALRAAARDALEGVRARPAPTAWAVLAIATGAFATGLLLAVLDGLRERAAYLVADFGADVLAVRAPGAEAPGRRPLRTGHRDLLRAALPDGPVAGVREVAVRLGPGRLPATALACDADLPRVRGWRLAGGRWLDPADASSPDRVAVLDAATAGRLRVRPGKTVSLDGSPWLVAGIFSTDPAAAGEAREPEAGSEALVLVPLPLAPALGAVPGDRLDAVYARIPGGAAAYRRALSAARRVLAGPAAPSNAVWITPERLLARLREWQRLVRLAAGGVAALALLLGAATLMSLMTAAVRERTAEIGLRRSIGARPADIAGLFLAEAAAVSGAAALAGSASALGLVALAADRLPLPLRPGAGPLLLPVAAAVLLALLFAGWPARRAAALPPAEALRNE